MVISAAHCVGGDPHDSMVLAGVHDLDHLSSKLWFHYYLVENNVSLFFK